MTAALPLVSPSAASADGLTAPTAKTHEGHRETALRLGIIKVQGGSERITRRPAQPRSNLARYRSLCDLISQLEDARDMTGPRRARVLFALLDRTIDALKELAGDSLVKIEKQEESEAA